MDYGRILDANLNRAREGLRVVEEICRFQLNDQKLFERLKALRHLLKQGEATFQPTPLLSREVATDVGKEPHPLEQQRRDLKGLLKANCKRVEESLRVLEEFSKLQGNGGELFKKGRFAVYQLEQEIVLQLPPTADFSVYLLTDDSYLSQPDFFSVLEACLQAGVTALQYRAKQITGREMYQQGEQLRELTNKYRLPLLINDRLDLALAVGADGVHLGQSDLPLEVAQKLLGDKIIGVSASTYEQAVTAIQQGADYIGLGPIYATATKLDTLPPCGLGLISRLKAEFPKTELVAIGGLTTINAGEVLQSGADGLAIISAILGSPHPTTAVQEFKKIKTR